MSTDLTMIAHQRFRTIYHEHLDSLVFWASGNIPDSGLNLVKCEDGRWFVKVDHGDDYDGIDGIFRPNLSEFTEPHFHDDELSARAFAYNCIRKFHVDLKAFDFDAYYLESLD